MGVPPVVAVVVVNDAGPWFAQTLESLAAQDYPNLGVLVIDNHSKLDPTETVAAVLPRAFVTRLDKNVGFGPAANRAKNMVEGAAFYLFCHDDVVLHPGATQALVEEAFRENAGIVGAKIVDAESPQTLIEIGWSVDRFGFRTPVAEPGELDQEQHDATRDTFAVSDVAMLVRTDLFETIGGFADDLSGYDADIDICWRAHIAGARVIVAPNATVAHRQAGIERPSFAGKRRAEYRARGRMLLSNYTPGRTMSVLPVAMFFSFLELLACLVTIQFDKAADIVRSWAWNLAHLPGTMRRRGQIKRFRVAPDSEVARFQVRGSASIAAFLRGTAVSSTDRINVAVGSSRSLIDKLREGPDRMATMTWLFVVVVIGLGSRSLIGGRIPALREFTDSYESSSQMLGSFWSGWRTTGIGGAFAPPTISGFMGALATLFFGSTAFARWLLIVGLLPIGIAGAWWWMRGSKSSQVRGVAMLVYVVAPVSFNALSEGRWSSLAMWAMTPWVIGLVGRVAGIAPFATSATRLSAFKAGAGLAFAGGSAALVFPAAPFALVTLGLCMLVGGVVGRLGGGKERARWDQAAIAVGIGAGGTIALQLPWYLGFSNGIPSWTELIGPQANSGGRLTLRQLLTFDTGSNSIGIMSGALILVGLLALAASRQWRFRLAVQGVVLGLSGLVLSWLGQVGIGPSMPAVETTLVVMAAGLAILAASSMGSFELDVTGGDFGWKQVIAALSGLSIVIACLPIVAAAFDGRWHVPREDHAELLHTVDPGSASPNYRVLWLGQADVLPTGSWDLVNGVRFATTEGLDPHAGDWFAGPESDGTKRLRTALLAAARGETGHLGHLLAPMGIKYVVVVNRFAPSSVTSEVLAPDLSFVRSIEEQADLSTLPISVAMTFFTNNAWVPTRAAFPAGVLDLASDDQAALVQTDITAAKAVLNKVEGARSFEGKVTAGTDIHIGATPDPNWKFSVDGKTVGPKSSFGWASRYLVPSDGVATLEWETPPLRVALIVLQVALWIAVLNILFGQAFAKRIGLRTTRPSIPRSDRSVTTRNRRSSSTSALETLSDERFDSGAIDVTAAAPAGDASKRPLPRLNLEPSAKSEARRAARSASVSTGEPQPRGERRHESTSGQTAPGARPDSRPEARERAPERREEPGRPPRPAVDDFDDATRPHPGTPTADGSPVAGDVERAVRTSPTAPTTAGAMPPLDQRAKGPSKKAARPRPVAATPDASFEREPHLPDPVSSAASVPAVSEPAAPASERGSDVPMPATSDMGRAGQPASALSEPTSEGVDSTPAPAKPTRAPRSAKAPKVDKPPKARRGAVSMRGAGAATTTVGAAKGDGPASTRSKRRAAVSPATGDDTTTTPAAPKKATRSSRRTSAAKAPETEAVESADQPSLFNEGGE